MLGLNKAHSPRFLKYYANVGDTIVEALETYIEEVENRSFPSDAHGYAIKEEEFDRFIELVDGKS